MGGRRSRGRNRTRYAHPLGELPPGEIPDFEDDESISVYTEAPDSLKGCCRGCILVKNRIKRVMPQLRMLALNLNRMTGALPDWVLYHPALDWWDPFTLLFNQEGKDEQGNLAGFSNEPANMDYYYQAYPKKKLANMTDEDAPKTATTPEPRDNNDSTR